MNGVIGQPFGAVAAGDRAADLRGDHAVDIADGQIGFHMLAAFDGRLAQVEQQLGVERVLQAVVLGDHAAAADTVGHLGLVEQRGEIHAAGFPMIHRQARLQPVGAPDHLIHAAEAKFRHPLAHFLGDEVHKIHHVGGVAGEVLAQFWILGGHPGGTGIQVADAHHHAAEHHQRARWQSQTLQRPAGRR